MIESYALGLKLGIEQLRGRAKTILQILVTVRNASLKAG